MALRSVLMMKMNYLDEADAFVGVFEIRLRPDASIPAAIDENLGDHAEIVVYVPGRLNEPVSEVRERLFARAKAFLTNAVSDIQHLDFDGARIATAAEDKADDDRLLGKLDGTSDD